MNFDRHAQDASHFVKKLAKELEHPDEIARSGIILRSVLHTLRDRLTISESFDVLAQLPMFLKAIYVDNWKYREQPTAIATVEEFKDEVKRHQNLYGEREFNWSKSTEDLIHTVMEQLGDYLSEGESRHIVAQLPEELRAFFSESLHVH